MDWIKKHYDQFALAAVSLILLASSVLLASSAFSFKGTFANLQQTVQHNNKITGLPIDTLEKAKAESDNPTLWAPKKQAGSLFVSERYLLKDGKLGLLTSGTVHDPVPNDWLLDNNLDIQDPEILNQDPDQDGFSNLDEWKGGTNPNDPKSHPAYVTKLRLKKFIKKPFRLKFNSYDDSIKKPEDMAFQIDTIDLKGRTQFRKIGEDIKGTKFKVTKFEHKTSVNSNDVEVDLSEVTVYNTEEDKSVVLVYQKVVDSPDSYALLKYLWNGDEITVKKDKTFKLKPTDDEYKLIDISDSEALIESSKGEKIKIPRLEEP
ncbi:MAG: Amuc_1099 family pilus-like system protein [Verrucomicrobiota bacterium]